MKKKYIVMALASLGLASCSIDEVDTFDGHNYLSFQKSELTYTFAFEDDDVTSKEFDLPVVYAGRYFDKDATFSIVAVDKKSTATEGVDYEMVNASQQIIKAGTNEGNGKIRLLRSETLKEENLTLVLAIAQNADFLPGVVDTLTVTISDQIVQPTWWDYSYSSYYLGNYSKAKMLLWFEFMGVNDGSNPLDTDEYREYVWYTGYTAPSIVYYDYAVRPKVAEFRRWLINTKGNPIDEALGVPIANTLGNF